MTSILQGIGGIWDTAVRAIGGIIRDAQQRQERQQQVVQYTQGSGERFRIEPDQVPQVIADLRSALVKLQQIRMQAEAIARTPSPGLDEVSTNAVRQIGHMAMGPEGSLKAALDAYEVEITKTITGLENDLKTYLGIEEINVPPAAAWA